MQNDSSAKEDNYGGHHGDSVTPDDHSTESLAETLDFVIAQLPDGQVTLAEIRDMLGEGSLLILVALLVVVFLVPVSIPGVSTVFGTAILLISVSRILGRSLWLPQRVASRTISSEKLSAALSQGAKWLHRLEKISKPRRLPVLVLGKPAGLVNNVAMIAGTLMLVVPLGLVPFTNTLPALALLAFSIGLLQKDGLCVLGGHLLNLATAAYFAALALGGGVAIQELFKRAAGWLF